MNTTTLDTMLWVIQRENVKRYGMDVSGRDMLPLHWYIHTGRASYDFLKKLYEAKPFLIARDLHKGGSYEEVIDRVCKRIGYERNRS